MTVEEMYQELQEQLLEETLSGVVDPNYYDDCSYNQVDIDYTTQDWQLSDIVDSLRSGTEGVDLCLIVCHTTTVETTKHDHWRTLR